MHGFIAADFYDLGASIFTESELSFFQKISFPIWCFSKNVMRIFE